MKFDDDFAELVNEVRAHRLGMPYCPSAEPSVDVNLLITKFCDDDFYREDYQAITSYFVADYVAYEDVVERMRLIAKTGMF